MRRTGMNSALLGKIRDSELHVIEKIEFEKPRTKEMRKLIETVGLKKSVLIGVESHDKKRWLSVRNLPKDLVNRIKAAADKRGRSMEQEVREILMHRYMPRDELLQRIRERWEKIETPTAAEVDAWTQTGRP